MDPLTDPSLSLRAKGAYAVIQSFGPDAGLNVELIAARSRDGVEATRSAIRELKRRGYVRVERTRGEGGLMGPSRYVLTRPKAQLPLRYVNHGAKHSSIGWTYAVSAADRLHIKIGTSASPDRRLRSHNTSSPVPLSIIWLEEGGMDLEYYLHDYFESRRIRGEWFDFTGLDAVEEIVAAAAKFGRVA